VTDQMPSAPAGPPPLQPAGPPALQSHPPGLPPAPQPAHQKLTLYASGALVVLIVLVIIFLGAGPRRAILPYVPMGRQAVQVVDLSRYLAGPVHAALVSAGHPSVRRLEAAEQKRGASFGREVLLLGEADHMTILVGRLRPDALRATFETLVKAEEKRINQDRAQPAKLEITRDGLEGRPYYSCSQELLDLAFASVGSSVACFADVAGVRSFLKTCAGISKPILSDEDFAAVYSPRDARRAFVYRLEKAGGRILAQTLADVVGAKQTDIRAAFFALATAGKSIEVTVRFLITTDEWAAAREEQFNKDTGQKALCEVLGAAPRVRVTRRGNVVTLEASVPLARFQEIAVQDKQGQARNLILALLAR